MRKIKLRSFPCSYYIDVGNICNLKCVLCPTANHSISINKMFMDFETYKKIFDKIKDYAFFVKLYKWGEPFLNKDILKIIEYTKKNKVGVIISTNFNLATDNLIESLVKLKVDRIIISLDGTNQKSYSSYRRNGNFNQVMENMEKLIMKKRELNSNKPDVVWQYLVNKKNESFIQTAKKMAEEIGVGIEFPKFQISQEIVKIGEEINWNLVEEWIPDKLKNNPINYLFVDNPPCNFLYHTMTINPDGAVMPCCAIYDPKKILGIYWRIL